MGIGTIEALLLEDEKVQMIILIDLYLLSIFLQFSI